MAVTDHNFKTHLLFINFFFEWGFNWIYLFQYKLNDTHFQLLVHWAGEGSDAIIALGRNRSRYFFDRRPSNSTVWLSTNYGSSFHALDMKINDSTDAIIEEFFVSPIENTRVSKNIFSSINCNLYHILFFKSIFDLMTRNISWKLRTIMVLYTSLGGSSLKAEPSFRLVVWI